MTTLFTTHGSQHTMFIVATFYHFFDFPQYQEKRAPLLALLKSHGIKGSLLIASEGINGTISGTRKGIDAVLGFVKKEIVGGELDHKESVFGEQPFGRAKVRLKKELISLGVETPSPLAGEAEWLKNDIRMSFFKPFRGGERESSDPTHRPLPLTPSRKGRGKYIDPKDWNALISDPDTLVLDARNSYETHLGTFKGAVDPNIRTFKQLPAYVEKNLGDKKRTIATFCTGGIRCEKFTAWMIEQGFENVFHLKGGILKYLEEVPEAESRWKGECYVFDERVAVGHGLAPSATASMCRACGHALTPEDRGDKRYKENENCPYCERGNS